MSPVVTRSRPAPQHTPFTAVMTGLVIVRNGGVAAQAHGAQPGPSESAQPRYEKDQIRGPKQRGGGTREGDRAAG